MLTLRAARPRLNLLLVEAAHAARSRRHYSPSPPAYQRGSRTGSSSVAPRIRNSNVINLLLAANCAVFAAYWHLDPDSPWRRPFMRYLVLRPSVVRKGEYWSLLGSVFTHLSPLHLGLNMLALHGFGTAALGLLGPGAMVGLYTAAGIAGSLAQVSYPTVARALGAPAASAVDMDEPAVGASGAIAGLISYVCLRLPAGMVYILVLPLPNRVFLPLFIGGSAWLAWSGGASSVGHASHLGGALVGALMALRKH